ncbi:MAG: hypothetical protein RML94_04540, partial [Bacteroidia bacterium]|nr:hypothetical protein [Bacteroidia bacterium]
IQNKEVLFSGHKNIASPRYESHDWQGHVFALKIPKRILNQTKNLTDCELRAFIIFSDYRYAYIDIIYVDDMQVELF